MDLEKNRVDEGRTENGLKFTFPSPLFLTFQKNFLAPK